MSKWIFRTLLALLAIYCFAYAFISIFFNGLGNYGNIDALRVTLQDRDTGGAGPPVAVLIPLFGPDGCVLDSALWTSGPPDSGNLTLARSNAGVNGYRLETVCEPLSSGRGGHEMIAVVQGRAAEGGDWFQLSDINPACSQRLKPYLGLNESVCWRTAGSVIIDWSWYVRYLGTALVTALGFSVTLVLAMLGRQRTARLTLLATLWLYAANLAAGAVGRLAGLQSLACMFGGLMDLTFVVPFSLFAFGLTIVRRSVVSVLLSFVTVHMAGTYVRDVVIPQIVGTTPMLSGPLVLDMVAGPQGIALLLAVGLLVVRSRALAKARSLVSDDFADYDTAWKELTSDPKVLSDLHELQLLLRQGWSSRKCHTVRQLHRALSSTRQERRSGTAEAPQPRPSQQFTESGTNISVVDIKRPIRSLDQLFFQAKCLHPILLRKVQQLAEASGGGGCARITAPVGSVLEEPRCTPPCAVMGRSGLVFQLASQDVGGTKEIIWGNIKSVSRAIEKAIRAYKQVRTALGDLAS